MLSLRTVVANLRPRDKAAALTGLEEFGTYLDAATRSGSQAARRAVYAERDRLHAVIFSVREGIPATGATDEVLAMVRDIEAILASPDRGEDERLGHRYDPEDED